jgi:DNA-binding PadR family transcriptional regulator
MSRRLPSLTPLQFVVLGALLAGEHRGRVLRGELARHGVRRSAPAFYQMMARLEDAGWVEGAYTQEIVEGQIIKERAYKITASGQRVWTATRDFYTEAGDRFTRQAGVAHA